MSFRIRAALAAVVAAAMFNVGCGDTFRPIAIPIIQPGGQPQAPRQALLLSTAGPGADGDTTHINVSGDTNVGQVVVGRNPVHAALISSGTIAVVVNAGEESLSVYSALAPTTAQPPIFISLPVGSAPSYAYSNVNGTVYVTESGTNKVGVVTLSGTPALTAEVAMGAGANPVGLIGTPDGSRLYVANKGNGTVSVIDTGTNALLASGLPNPIVVGGNPVFLAVNTNGTRVFAVNSGGYVSVIDTATNTFTNVAVGANPNYAYFDGINNKLWVTNSGGNSVSAFAVDVNATPPFTVATIALPGGCTPVSITVLADGSRAYVADSGCGAVTVINAISNTISKSITVGTAPKSIASSPDSSKVYTANNGSANASIIRTSDDTLVTNIAAPAGTSPIFVTTSPF